MKNDMLTEFEKAHGVGSLGPGWNCIPNMDGYELRRAAVFHADGESEPGRHPVAV